MAEEIVETPETVESNDGGAPAEAEITEQPQEEPKEHMIPKSRFDEVREERNKLRAEMDEIAEQRKQQEIDAKKAEGKYKELYEELETKLANERIANEQLKLDSLRKEIARKHGYSFLWDRLRGETEEEIESDLQILIRDMPAPTAPSVGGAAGSGSRSNEPDDEYSDAELKEMSARLNIPVRFLDKKKPIFE